jgi:hypothetical protein
VPSLVSPQSCSVPPFSANQYSSHDIWSTACEHDEQAPEIAIDDPAINDPAIWEEQDEYLLLFVVMLYLILKDIFGWGSFSVLQISKKSTWKLFTN